MCHDEPRESAKVSRTEQTLAGSENGLSSNEAEHLPCMQAASVDPPQGKQQMLQEAGLPLSQMPVTSSAQMNPIPFMSHSSNVVAQGLNYDDKNQPCKDFAHDTEHCTEQDSLCIQ